MAKNAPSKPNSKTEPAATEAAATVTKPPASASPASASPEAPVPQTVAASSTSDMGPNESKSANPTASMTTAKKDIPAPKPKKPISPATKPASMLPSAHKLEHLKAAVNAAGGIENLLTILQHVDEAGGRAEVADSIEAYRVLKTVLEESDNA